jgi:hypothetical protein
MSCLIATNTAEKAEETKPDQADSLRPDQLSLNGCETTLGRVPICGIPEHWEFPDKLAVNQPAVLPEGCLRPWPRK